MAEQKVSLNLLGLPISLRFKRMKYARIRINKECEISVSVPRSYTAAQAENFILKHESWIRQTLERLRSKLLASDQVRILGKIYKLKFSREVELGTNCGADEVLCNDSERSRVDDDASDGTGGGTGSEILKFRSGERTSQSGAAGENLKFNLPGDAAQGLSQQSEMRQGGGFINTATQNVFEQSCGENLKFHSDGCVSQSSNVGKFNSASSGEILKFNPAARGEILKFKPVAGERISNFKPAASGEILNFNSVKGEDIPFVSERTSKAASENVPQNVAQSVQAAERDEPDFTIKNFIQSSKFKDKIFMSRDVIFCESESEFAAFKKAFALELYLRYIAKFSPRIGRKIARVRMRKMQTRWGSCNHAKGYLNFSLSLIEQDRRFVEYVVLHELAHLIHANHGADFYALIAQIMPDFRARIKLGKG
ncbi:M48 family metallopeptidase [uncultured Campylobacter sp.]|uniref:M48 metallopeptidase family protein n=1 Tax=uncultured Campylobacter sp. TaxID=218934 RepID=UPI00261489BB|nr:M48 family metallopeptidase [uncultured Campylobacter sp.]